ncbi:uncharacterized protein LOC142772020 isoform X3 [Rhipicephalus microplus]|uniref:uncharacterized protein LOC142772020 isoform X3 n=1 Tax=Rhipicephalus microplus TaxID=6941 RepID=UPI003F6CFEF6
MRRRESVSFSFVNTTDPIWTYKTTNDGEVICEVDEMESITQVDFLFRKLFLMRRRRFEVPLRGQFYHFQPDRMTITSRGNNIRYDLQVKNSTIRHGPTRDCRRYLHRVKGPRMLFTIYSHDCQRMSTSHQQATFVAVIGSNQGKPKRSLYIKSVLPDSLLDT